MWAPCGPVRLTHEITITVGFSVLGVLSFLSFNKSKHVILAAITQFQNNSLFFTAAPLKEVWYSTLSRIQEPLSCYAIIPGEFSLALWPKMASPLSVFTQVGGRWRIAPWEIYTLLLLISYWLELSHMAKFQFTARDTGKQFLFLATEERGRLQSMGSQRVGHD